MKYIVITSDDTKTSTVVFINKILYIEAMYNPEDGCIIYLDSHNDNEIGVKQCLAEVLDMIDEKLK